MSSQSETCVFCGKPADTREHVFAKCFFDKPYPNNLLTVPSCYECNHSYSIDEQYLMYLIEYLKSVESNDGEFVRSVAEKTFQHSEGLEDRMMSSLTVDENGNPVFIIEKERVNRVVSKIARCLFLYHYGISVPANQLHCIWSFKSQMMLAQRDVAERINYSTLQAGLVKYYYTPREIGFCLSEFFYGCARIV